MIPLIAQEYIEFILNVFFVKRNQVLPVKASDIFSCGNLRGVRDTPECFLNK
jgi:hypothetical protein